MQDKFESSGIENVVLALQNDADIRTYLNSGLRPEQIVLLFQYRARLIMLIAELLEGLHEASPDYSFEFYMELISRDINSFSDMPPASMSRESIDQSVNSIIKALNSMEMEMPGEARQFSAAEWEVEARALYEEYKQLLPADAVARETATQLIDLDQGTGVWVHIPN